MSDLNILNFISKKANRGELRTRCDAINGVLKVTVSYTGSGISKEGISKLFNRFAQVSSDSSRRKLGTGLGLFITYRDTSQTLTLSSLNVGNIKSVLASKNLRALIIDDHTQSLNVVQNFLKKLGIEAITMSEDGLNGYRSYYNQWRL